MLLPHVKLFQKTRRNIFLVLFYQLKKLHCLVAFTLYNIGQCEYWKCLFSSLWRHSVIILIKSFFLTDEKLKKLRQKLKSLENEKSFRIKTEANKTIFLEGESPILRSYLELQSTHDSQKFIKKGVLCYTKTMKVFRQISHIE